MIHYCALKQMWGFLYLSGNETCRQHSVVCSMSIVLFMSMLHFLDFVTVSLVIIPSSMFTVGVIEVKIL